MGTWRNVERGGHKGKEKDCQSKERSPAAAGIERRGIVDRGDAKEAHGENHGGPEVPTFPEGKDSEYHKTSGKEEGGIPVCARVERAKNVAAIELGDGDEVQGGEKKTNPSGAADGRQEKSVRGDARVEDGVQETKQKRSAVDEFGVGGVGEAGNELGMEDAVEESGNGEDETDERAGSADIKQGAVGEDGGANQDEGAEGAVQVWEGNEKRVGGANMVVTAGEEMAEFMGEENKEKSKCERETGGEAEGVLVKESKGAEKFIGGEGLVLGIGGGELRAGDEAGAESEEEEDAGEEQHFSGRTVRSRNVADAIGRGGAPIDVGREGWRRIYWEGWGHGIFCA